MKKRLPILFALLAAGAVHAQDGLPVREPRLEHTAFRLGAYGGWGMNFHDTKANIFNGGGECGAFEDGEGSGPVFGLLGEFPIMGEWLDLTASVYYAQRGGDFAAVYTGGLPILDPNSGEYTHLVRKHAYNANLGYMLGEFGLRFAPLPDFPIYLRAAASVAIPLGPSHRQTEEIVSPGGVLYPETNTVEREVSSGPLNDPEMPAALAGTLGYSFAIDHRWSISPELSWYYPIGDVTPHYEWKVTSAQAGIAVKYSFGPEVIDSEPEPPPPPPPIVEIPPSAELGVTNPRQLDIIKTVVTETFPILPYIFFDSAAATIPSRYQQLTDRAEGAIEESKLPRRSLGAYYSILDIVGGRMTENGGAKITVNGTTDGREETVAGTANNLARARAQTVKDYLVTKWEIDPARIRVTTSPMPTYPSSTLYTEGYQENRRVEIGSTDDNVLKPIIYERLNEYSAEPSHIEFYADVPAGVAVDSWRMTISSHGSPIWDTWDRGAPPAKLKWDLDQDILGRVAGTTNSGDSLDCALALLDAEGQPTKTTYFRLPANVVQQPFEVSRLSLVVFDFDRADINPQNRRMVSSFVSRSMTPSSTSSITGSTDRLGEFAHNQKLSEQRAQAVRDLIVAERPDVTITSTQGIGPSKLPYDNDLPEGRYYCRTVTVEVKTPLETVNDGP